MATRVARRFLARLEGGYLYTGAGAGAQPEIIAAITRFREMSFEERAEFVSLWGWLLGNNGTPPYKPTKADLGYVEHAVDGHSCGGCNSIYLHVEEWVEVISVVDLDKPPPEGCAPHHGWSAPKGTYICDRMKGVIEPGHWCRKWHERMDPLEYREYQG